MPPESLESYAQAIFWLDDDVTLTTDGGGSNVAAGCVASADDVVPSADRGARTRGEALSYR